MHNASKTCQHLMTPLTLTRRLLSGLVLGLVITGCSASYNGERLFWKAQQVQAAALKNKKEANQLTAAETAKIVNAYAVVIQRVPGSIWAAQSQGTIGSLYATQKQYDKAREAYGLVVQNFNQYQGVALAARVAMAKTYELEQRWNEAMKWYNEIADLYPWSSAGLSAPLRIAVMYEKHQAPELATQSYERAVGMYTKRIPDAPTPEMAFIVKGYLALAYQRLSQWDLAVTTLEELLKARAGINRPLALLTLATIYDVKLHVPEKAIAAYTTFTQEFPNHPLGKVAKAQLGRLAALKTDSTSAAPMTPAIPAVPLPSTATR